MTGNIATITIIKSPKYLLFLLHLSVKAGKWPVKCKSDKQCLPSKIRTNPGWENSKAKNLICDEATGDCICRKAFMDKNYNPYDGCEFEKCRKGWVILPRFLRLVYNKLNNYFRNCASEGPSGGSRLVATVSDQSVCDVPMTQVELDNCRGSYPMMTVTQCQEFIWARCQENQCLAECLPNCDENDWACRDPCYYETCDPCYSMCNNRCTEVTGLMDSPDCIAGCNQICRDFNSDHSGEFIFYSQPTMLHINLFSKMIISSWYAPSHRGLVYKQCLSNIIQSVNSRQRLIVRKWVKFHHIMSHLALLPAALMKTTVMEISLADAMAICLVMNHSTVTAIRNVSRSIATNPTTIAIKDVLHGKRI